MEESAVRELLLGRGIDFAPQSTIFATIKPSVGAYENGLGSVMNAMREHVLHFSSSGIAVVPIDDRNGRLAGDKLLFLPNASIESLDMKMRALHLELTISTPKGEILYKIRRSVIGSPWHKANVQSLILRADVKD